MPVAQASESKMTGEAAKNLVDAKDDMDVRANAESAVANVEGCVNEDATCWNMPVAQASESNMTDDVIKNQFRATGADEAAVERVTRADLADENGECDADALIRPGKANMVSKKEVGNRH